MTTAAAFPIAHRGYPNARSYVLQRSGYVVLYNVDPGAAVVTVVRVRNGSAGR